MRGATRWQRHYQRQLVTLSSPYIYGTINAGATGQPAPLAVLPSDQVLRLYLRVAFNGDSSYNPVKFGVSVQAVDVTTSMAPPGPWTGYPVIIDLSSQSLAGFDSYTVAAINKDTRAADIEYQLFADVLR